jgi:hypothetical protein
VNIAKYLSRDTFQLYFPFSQRITFSASIVVFAWQGIGIEKTNAGIGIPACRILVRYQTTKMPDCVSLVRYRTCSGIVSFFQSGTELTGCWTVRHSGMSIFFNMDIDMGMQH